MHPTHTPCKHPQERAGCTECLHLAHMPSYKTREVIDCRKKHSLPQSYSTRVNEANQIHVHKLQLSKRIQRKNRFKTAEKIVCNHPKNCLKSAEKLFKISLKSR